MRKLIIAIASLMVVAVGGVAASAAPSHQAIRPSSRVVASVSPVESVEPVVVLAAPTAPAPVVAPAPAETPTPLPDEQGVQTSVLGPSPAPRRLVADHAYTAASWSARYIACDSYNVYGTVVAEQTTWIRVDCGWVPMTGRPAPAPAPVVASTPRVIPTATPTPLSDVCRLSPPVNKPYCVGSPG